MSIMLINGTLSSKGISHTVTKFDFQEKDRCYWLQGGAKRVSKDLMMKPYTRFANDMKIAGTMKLQIWCFAEDEKQATDILDNALIGEYLQLKATVDYVGNGILKQVLKRKNGNV